MPSVFTIAGTEGAPRKKAKKASRSRSPRKSRTPGTTPAIGFCKPVKNPHTGCSMKLCYVGKGAKLGKGGKSKTGWAFEPGSSSCPRR